MVENVERGVYLLQMKNVRFSSPVLNIVINEQALNIYKYTKLNSNTSALKMSRESERSFALSSARRYFILCAFVYVFVCILRCFYYYI